MKRRRRRVHTLTPEERRRVEELACEAKIHRAALAAIDEELEELLRPRHLSVVRDLTTALAGSVLGVVFWARRHMTDHPHSTLASVAGSTAAVMAAFTLWVPAPPDANGPAPNWIPPPRSHGGSPLAPVMAPGTPTPPGEAKRRFGPRGRRLDPLANRHGIDTNPPPVNVAEAVGIANFSDVNANRFGVDPVGLDANATSPNRFANILAARAYHCTNQTGAFAGQRANQAGAFANHTGDATGQWVGDHANQTGDTANQTANQVGVPASRAGDHDTLPGAVANPSGGLPRFPGAVASLPVGVPY